MSEREDFAPDAGPEYSWPNTLTDIHAENVDIQNSKREKSRNHHKSLIFFVNSPAIFSMFFTFSFFMSLIFSSFASIESTLTRL